MSGVYAVIIMKLNFESLLIKVPFSENFESSSIHAKKKLQKSISKLIINMMSKMKIKAMNYLKQR